MTDCISKDRKFSRFSPGCGGTIDYSVGLSEMNPKTRRFKAVPGKACRLHHLENAHGIYALECPKCKKLDHNYRDRIQAKADMAMDDMDKFTYIPLEIMIAPARGTWYISGATPFTVRCWHCGFIFFKGRRATKAERERNERQGLKEIPEITPEQLKSLKGESLP